MSKVILTEQHLTDIADAIRNKNHQTASYTPSQMAPAIDALEGDTVVQGAGPWTITVTNPAHTYITSTPEAFIAPEGGAYSPRLRTKENITMDTGYLPGRVLKNADAQTNVISITAEPATEIEGMINDGWALVYMDENSYYYSDSACTQLLTSLTGKVAVAGMPGNESEDLNTVNIGPSLEYRNDFTQSLRFNTAFNTTLVSCSFKNLTTAGDDLLNGCSSLTSVDLSSLTTAGSYLLNGCSSLTSVDLSSLTTAGDDLLDGCSSLTSVDLSSLTTAGSYLLNGCSSLTSVDLSSLTTAGSYLLSGCSSLTSVDLSSLTTAGDDLLNGCSSLTSVDLSSLTTAGSYLLSGCSSLTSVRFAAADDLSPLFSQMRLGDALLSTLILARDSVMLCENVSYYIPPSCNIYVPSSLVAAYKAHPHWSEFPNIQAMTEGM